jgi:phosphatidylethanolamine/phosphatidyl-N-methylethanolamine N-methyltransferase
MSIPQELPQESQLYHQLSRLYDPIFAQVFGPRIRRTIRSFDIPPQARVLEVGVGTGLSLSAYPTDVRVTGIDLSSNMLSRAQKKLDRWGWDHISLRQMDALNMQLEDESFDFVFAFHVVTVVPDPDRLVREMLRVCKPHGRIVIINHFRSERRWVAGLMDRLDPVTRRLGWSTTLGLPELVDTTPLNVERRFKTSALSLFTIVTAKRNTEHGKQGARDAASPPGMDQLGSPAGRVSRQRRERQFGSLSHRR